MAFGGSSGAGVRSDINITPLVDVVLVLLIIFMVMTPSLLKEVDVKVPEKPDVETQVVAAPNTDEVIVSIGADGRLQINREPITDAQLGDRMRELMAARSEKRVFFDIDDDSIYADAMHAMDVCRGAGAKTLGLMTKESH
jgi:biopolymer transport protein TolR